MVRGDSLHLTRIRAEWGTMKIISALIIGFLSGCLVHMLVAMVFLQHAPIEAFVYNVVFSVLAGWCLTTLVVYRGAESASRVWARGAVIGVAEWLMVGFAIVRVGKGVLIETMKDAAVGEGLSANEATGLFLLFGS